MRERTAMPQPAIFEPQIVQTDDITTHKPWERMEGEPARWFLRFRNYVRMGPRRSINAVFVLEREKKGEGKPGGKAGTRWYEAALRWQWQSRAEASDAFQEEQKAATMRDIAARLPFVSRPFRLTQLNILAVGLMRKTEEGLPITDYVVCVRLMQSLLHDIADEVREWGVTVDATADSAALAELEHKNARLRDLDEQRELDEEAEIERLLARHDELQESVERARKLQAELKR
jgi:hypothetical protein